MSTSFVFENPESTRDSISLERMRDILKQIGVKPDVLAEPKASEYERPEYPYGPLGAADEVFLIHPLSRYRLGLLYEKAGEIAKAKVQYQEFLDLWKNADPDQPEVEDVRRKLKGLEGR